MSSNILKILKNIECRASYLYKNNYIKNTHTPYNNLMIENLICDGRCHLVAVFKNYLIEDDNSEYLHRFYKYRESCPRLKKLFLLYDETSVIFPNYTPLIESQYLYNNVIKKQRVIDEQQDLENKRNKLKLNKNKNEKLIKEDKVINSTIFGDMFTGGDSILRIVFGIENKDNVNKNDNYNKNKEQKSNENKSVYNDSDELKTIIKEIEIAEQKLKNKNNENTLARRELNSNNALKYRLKIINNNHSKNKNVDKLNNMTNNSTNITSSSNININQSVNLNSIKNNHIKNTKKLGILNQINRNYLNIINNYNFKNTYEDSNYKNRFVITNRKIIKSTIPNRTKYELKFNNINNNIVTDLNNPVKRKNLKNNSNANTISISRIKFNNYFNNNDYQLNSKLKEKVNLYNDKYDLNNKQNKILSKIPKIDIHNLDLFNKNNEKILTFTNRNSNRNNNRNLFFRETEAIKSERNIEEKRYQDNIKMILDPILTFSSTNLKSKVIFDKNKDKKMYIINDIKLKSISQRKKNSQYFSNKNGNKSSKKLVINNYNLKTSQIIKNKGKYNNKFYRIGKLDY